MRKFSEITQTEDTNFNPLPSNLDSSIQSNSYKDLDLKNRNSILKDDSSVTSTLNSADELELSDRRRNFAGTRVKYIESKKCWAVVRSSTNEFLYEIKSNKELKSHIGRNNLTMLQKTFASLNVYEKEIILWIRLNYPNYLDTFDLVLDIMREFNISESRSNYLLDSSGV